VFLAAHAWSLLVTFLSNSKLLYFTSATRPRIPSYSSCFWRGTSFRTANDIVAT
jgi:hypothetical protein